MKKLAPSAHWFVRFWLLIQITHVGDGKSDSIGRGGAESQPSQCPLSGQSPLAFGAHPHRLLCAWPREAE